MHNRGVGQDKEMVDISAEKKPGTEITAAKIYNSEKEVFELWRLQEAGEDEVEKKLAASEDFIFRPNNTDINIFIKLGGLIIRFHKLNYISVEFKAENNEQKILKIDLRQHPILKFSHFLPLGFNIDESIGGIEAPLSLLESEGKILRLTPEEYKKRLIQSVSLIKKKFINAALNDEPICNLDHTLSYLLRFYKSNYFIASKNDKLHAKDVQIDSSWVAPGCEIKGLFDIYSLQKLLPCEKNEKLYNREDFFIRGDAKTPHEVKLGIFLFSYKDDINYGFELDIKLINFFDKRLENFLTVSHPRDDVSVRNLVDLLPFPAGLHQVHKLKVNKSGNRGRLFLTDVVLEKKMNIAHEVSGFEKSLQKFLGRPTAFWESLLNRRYYNLELKNLIKLLERMEVEEKKGNELKA